MKVLWWTWGSIGLKGVCCAYFGSNWNGSQGSLSETSRVKCDKVNRFPRQAVFYKSRTIWYYHRIVYKPACEAKSSQTKIYNPFTIVAIFSEHESVMTRTVERARIVFAVMLARAEKCFKFAFKVACHAPFLVLAIVEPAVVELMLAVASFHIIWAETAKPLPGSLCSDFQFSFAAEFWIDCLSVLKRKEIHRRPRTNLRLNPHFRSTFAVIQQNDTAYRILYDMIGVCSPAMSSTRKTCS